jgi:hypothetical protein
MRQESVFLYLDSSERLQCGKQDKDFYRNIKRLFLLLKTTFLIIEDNTFSETIIPFLVLSV